MEIKGNAKLLRIYISSTDRFRYKPLYEVVLFAAKRYGMAGATVIRGFMGYGSSSVIRSQKLWELSEKVPMVIEIVDRAEKIDQFVEIILPYFSKVPKAGLIITILAEAVSHKINS
jgi:uncharacterized protein